MWGSPNALMLGSVLMTVSISSNPSTMGPYSVLFTSVGRCPKELNGKDTFFYTIKMQRVSRKRLMMYINASFATELSDEFTVLVNLAKSTNQGWKDNFFSLEIKKACTTSFSRVPQLSERLDGALKKKPCPLSAGNHTFALDLNSGTTPDFVPNFPYGKYRARCFIRRGTQTHFCIEGVVDVVPKKNG